MKISDTVVGVGFVGAGALIVAGYAGGDLVAVLGFLAVTFGTINIVGGYLVTDRMLRMFKRGPQKHRRHG